MTQIRDPAWSPQEADLFVAAALQSCDTGKASRSTSGEVVSLGATAVLPAPRLK